MVPKLHGETTRVTFGQVLRNRGFAALWLARFISSLGDWLAILPLFSLIAFQRHGSAPETAMVMVSFIIPVILLGPVAGVFVDRWDLKRTLILCDLICAVLATLLAFSGELYQMYLLMAGISAVSCFLVPAQTATLPLILAERELLVANAISVQTLQLNQIFAPAIVGFALVWLGEKTCFYLDAASFLLSALLVSTIRIAPRTASASVGKSVWGGLKDGIRFIAAHSVARVLVLTIAIANGAVAIFEALFAVYVRDVLGGGSRMFGSVTSALGVGAILGAFVVARFAQQVSRPRIINAGFLVQAASVLTLGALAWPLTTLAASVGLGVGAAFVFLSAQTFALEEVPPEMLGRVTSTASSVFAVVQLGSFIGSGFLAKWMGLRNLCYAAVLLLLATAAAAGFLIRKRNALATIKSRSSRQASLRKQNG
ncbi:MAG TPA: MFS transporter [Candidatus Angelobacter sp.]|jgi:MFS family permease|nr:MFS transporter [Candidatus Angelobacter sp.]